MSEHREFTRVPFPFPATFTIGGRSVVGQGVDVSAGGFRLCCAEVLPVGCQGILTVELGPGAEIAIEARVARCDGSELALAVTAIGPDSFEALRDLVRFNAPDLERVEEEFEAHLGLLRRDA